MRARIIALITLCGVIAFGLWFVRTRHTEVVQERVSQDATAVAVSEAPGISPPAAPSRQTGSPENSPPAASAGLKATDSQIPGATAPPSRLTGDGVRTMPGTIPGANAPAVSQPPPPPDDAPGVPSEKAAIDVDKITLSLRDFRTLTGGNPVGTNKEITDALNGGNPKQARLLPEGQAVNGNGELVDRWGTPYFFHQLSKVDMEIRSAGPDKKMWTEDDTVGR